MGKACVKTLRKKIVGTLEKLKDILCSQSIKSKRKIGERKKLEG